MANILTPDQRLRVFVSSTLQELADERSAARAAIRELRLSPVMFELGARPHPPRNLYRAYLEQSHIFVGIYWQHYGWVAPGEEFSGLEDEYRLCGNKPKLIYVKTPAPNCEDRLKTLLQKIQEDDDASYRTFSSSKELGELLENDLALLLTERFAASLETVNEEVSPAKRNPRVHLPAAQTELIGREREIDEVTGLLEQPHIRLVTLQGPGGVGKSRLGIEVARQLSKSFKDGVVFVPLSAITDPSLLIPTVADTLEAKEAPNVTRKDALKTYLANHEVLVLLDNFEQLETAARELSELLASSPSLKLLVTSRSTLRISAEHVYDVLPFEVPSTKEGNLKQVHESSAVKLFETRARAVRPNFALTPNDLPAVVEICRELDGLPLAIELAAAHLKMFSPQVLLKRLGKRFDLLKGGSRDLPDRQQTLRTTIDWSYDLLNEPHKIFFARLGVFIGGFSLEGAETVSGDAVDAFEGLISLTDKSLVRSGESEGEPYFTMLESIRVYAEEKFGNDDGAHEVRELHALYYLDLANASREALTGPEQGRWLRRLELERPNFRAALSWLIEKEEFGGAAQLAYALARFWMIRGHIKEGRMWLSKILTASYKDADKARADALIVAAVLADEAGDLPEALQLYDENVRLYKALGERRGLANSLTSLAGLWFEQGEYERSRTLSTESLNIFRELGDERGESGALNNLAVVANNMGEYDLAQIYAENALKILRDLGDEYSAASPLTNLGVLSYFRGDYSTARMKLTEVLEIYAEAEDERNVAATLELMARVTFRLGEAERAARLLGAAASIWDTADAKSSPSNSAEASETLAAVRGALGENSFEAAWERGRALSFKKAVKLAVSDLPTSSL